MHRMFKVCVLVLVSMVHLSSFGMNRANKLPIQPRDISRMTSESSRGQGMNRALATERARRYFDRLAEDSNKTKLLEHPCFPGESLKFQNDFFSSNYMDLPGRIASPIVLMTQGVPVDVRGLVFAYHAHYRKDCRERIDSFKQKSLNKEYLYYRHIERLMNRPHTMQEVLRLELMIQDDMFLRTKTFGCMTMAYGDNDYPAVLAIYQKYHDTPKPY